MERINIPKRKSSNTDNEVNKDSHCLDDQRQEEEEEEEEEEED
jgi:hypothetical protein